jgi:hypothetical protein
LDLFDRRRRLMRIGFRKAVSLGGKLRGARKKNLHKI